MPRKKKTKPLESGRPLIKIDWNLVDQLIEADCSGVEIAACFDIHYDTFYDRFKELYGIPFSEARPRKEPQGKAMIKLTQYKLAKQGNIQMLTLLGKERCGQGKPTDSTASTSLESFGEDTKPTWLPEEIPSTSQYSTEKMEIEQSLLDQKQGRKKGKV